MCGAYNLYPLHISLIQLEIIVKNVVVDLNKGEKLDGDNYDIWRRKIQYLLDEQGVLENLKHIM